MKIRSVLTNRYDDYFNPGAEYATGPQASRCIVELERNGFSVNVPLLNSKCETARQDEQLELYQLREDYRQYDFPSKTDDEIDAIWSSSKQLLELVHSWLNLEPSPIYKKGQVATWKGEVRLDGVALDYLGNKYKEHRVFLHRIRNLRTIRGCIKYLSKLPRFVGSDGLIHPTYGPMGDEDENSGTHTGRLGMKNPEGHQIPLEEEKDPYHIRECFDVPKGYVKIVRDYQAMEVVELAYLCDKLFDDQSLYEAVKLGGKFHSKNAYNVFGKKLGWQYDGRPISSYGLDEFKTTLSKYRKDAKTVWYGAQYRKSGRGFGFTLLDTDGYPIGENAGQDVLDAFLEEAPALQKWYDFTDSWLLSHTYMPTPGGRLRDFADLLEDNRHGKEFKKDWKFRSAARKAGNHPIQGKGAEIKTLAIWYFISNPRTKAIGAMLEMDMHDELHVRCLPEVADEVDAILKDSMERAGKKYGCITDGGRGTTWKDAK